MARVLVVEDDSDVRDLVSWWLRVDGHDVLAVDGAAAALTAVELHGMPDVAVLDVAMPGMDGVELLDALRRRDPALPALFLTALWSGTQVARMRVAHGVYLAKPATAPALRAQVRRLLSDASDASDASGASDGLGGS